MSTKKTVLATIAGVLAAGALTGGAFAGGQSTRPSTADVDRTVTAAVTAAVDRRAQQAKQDQAAAVKDARARQKRTDNRRWRRISTGRVQAATRDAREAGYQAGTSDGFSSGHVAGETEGFSQGHELGREDGLTEASDEIDCSDDPDVTWLPYCN